jgi:hypothetical protein
MYSTPAVGSKPSRQSPAKDWAEFFQPFGRPNDWPNPIANKGAGQESNLLTMYSAPAAGGSFTKTDEGFGQRLGVLLYPLSYRTSQEP